jgi:hypothetical protein
VDEKDPRVVDALNHLLITAIEKRWSTLLFECAAAPVPIEASGPWEDESLPGPDPEKARAMIERLTILAQFQPKGAVTGRGSFAMKWGKVTAQIAVDVEQTEDGLRVFLEFARH